MNPTDRQSFSPLLINGLSRPMTQAIKPFKLTPEVSKNFKESPGNFNTNLKFQDLMFQKRNIDILNSWERFKHLFTPRTGIQRKNINSRTIGKSQSNKNVKRYMNFPNKYLSNEYLMNDKSKVILLRKL